MIEPKHADGPAHPNQLQTYRETDKSSEFNNRYLVRAHFSVCLLKLLEMMKNRPAFTVGTSLRFGLQCLLC